jgi:hypothetical protein
VDHVILRERLASLERQLTLVERTLESAADTEELHAALDGTIGNSARQRQHEVGQIIGQLDEAETVAASDPSRASTLVEDAWRRYLRIYDDSRDIFGECLEFVGGLAIRSHQYDDQICKLADELIRSCATESIGRRWESLTVPAAPDALAKTLARMVRLRFPDWTVWTLPFTAHEYGHVVVAELSELKDFVRDIASTQAADRIDEVMTRVDGAELPHRLDAEERARLDSELRNLAQDALRDWLTARRVDQSSFGQRSGAVRQFGAEQLALAVRAGERELADAELRRATVLVADAFATYTMGPAYACAALLLHFLPAQPARDAGHAERAHIVLRTLERMNATGDNSYQDVITQVTAGWERVVSGPGAAISLTPAQTEELDGLLEDLWPLFELYLRKTARFEHAAEKDGWLAAKKVSLDWRTSLRDHPDQPLRTEGLGVVRLRDALNAAWYCRLLSFNDAAASGNTNAFRASIDALERATRETCTEIIDARKSQQARRARSQRRPGRRPPRAA